MADCSLWQSQVSEGSKGYFEAVTVMNSGALEHLGGYPMLKATPKRGICRVKSQPEPRLALKKLESIVYKIWLSLIPILGYFLIPSTNSKAVKQ